MGKRQPSQHAGLRPPLVRWMRDERVWLVLVAVCALVVVLAERQRPGETLSGQESAAQMLFVGDVLLARHVETLMDERGTYYPFRGVRDLFPRFDAVVGNFEAAIPERHVPTPSGAMRFSADVSVAKVLARAGFTQVSLANNHAYDYGASGFEHTRAALLRADVTPFGHPYEFSAAHIAYRTLNGVVVALIPLYAVVSTPDDGTLEEVLRAASERSDFQIVYPHWGEEYEKQATAAQRLLAYRLVDFGADAVIGHHPHVVSEMEEYRSALIFYSLGNFIFDQYWNDDVQEGLTIALSVTSEEVTYELIPVTSVEERSAPRPMSRTERSLFLSELAALSEDSLAGEIAEGRITRPLLGIDLRPARSSL